MNKVELIKSEKDGLDIRADIERFAKAGWESLDEADVQRLKWVGLFLRKPTPGFFMLRVRIPSGRAFSYQVNAVAGIAKRLGNGIVDITTRQQVQIRHLKIEDLPEVFDILEGTGLTSLQTGMDNVRNIMGCPVAGLHPKECIDASPFVLALNQLILENREFTNLPRKFNVAITGCPDNCIHTETQDLALVPASRRDDEGREVIGFNLLAGGKLGSGGCRFALPLDVFIPPEDLLEVCSAVILTYRDHGFRESRTQNRLAFLLEEWGEDRFREELERRLQRPLERAGKDLRGDSHMDHTGIYRQKQPFMNYVGLNVPVGRIGADKLEGIADLAQKYGSGEIRFSPTQNLILPNIADQKLGDLLEEPLLKELVYHPSSPMKGLVSCVGSDYCHLATIETKSRALEVARKLEDRLQKLSPITMHWSGCPASCGNHLVADIGLLGKRIKVGDRVVDGVDVFMGGRSGRDPKLALKILENVPCEELPQVLEGILPYHTRERMHRVRGQSKAMENKAKAKIAPRPAPLVEVEALV
ncbi:MAG: ferredoxin--nitrite reductase [Nitrospinaceae bacterium]|nr:MAG: ferredoxin--nitrite reductase [Nitrospinaceae bacterium]